MQGRRLRRSGRSWGEPGRWPHWRHEAGTAGLDSALVTEEGDRMQDPLTLTTIGETAITEGIKFLYTQAGEVLKRWRERKSGNSEAASPEAEPITVELPPGAFEGQLKDPRLDFIVIERLAPELRQLRAALADYAQDIDEVDPSNRAMLETVDALRRAMEAVYGQTLTFKGEPGPSSGTMVVAEAKADEVQGYVAGLRARKIIGATVVSRMDVGKIAEGGEAVAVDVDTIGP